MLGAPSPSCLLWCGQGVGGCRALPRAALGSKAAQLLEPALSLQTASTGGKKVQLRQEAAAGTSPPASPPVGPALAEQGPGCARGWGRAEGPRTDPQQLSGSVAFANAPQGCGTGRFKLQQSLSG